MALDFAALKKTRKTSLTNLVKEVEKVTQRNENKSGDDRFWKPEVDKSGNGYAVIRFLPAPQGEDLPWVKMYNHGFQGPGGWYIENSLTTIGEKDPVSEHNSMLWNSGIESNKEVARKQKRRLQYFSNILVVKDAANPENEGKVFLYQYGAKIFSKLQEAMQPEFEDEDPMNPFDFWEGADFKLKIRNVEGYRNYDRSEFDSPSTISDDDDEIEAIWNKQHSLSAFLEKSNFKSYGELKARLDKVLGVTDSTPVMEEETAPPPKQKVAEVEDDIPWSNDDEDDDSVSFFRSLAEDDD
tara:strand:- start:1281 stop:2171 length:891 start_codon:yes stop_codon:yes gene_type:complete